MNSSNRTMSVSDPVCNIARLRDPLRHSAYEAQRPKTEILSLNFKHCCAAEGMQERT